LSTAAPLLSRHLGDYLLVAQLSEDALGSVFRALHAADERRFVRLRILRSSELQADAIETAIRENAIWSASLAHPAIVDRPLLDVVEGIPFMTWDETSGWTLDSMLARVRAFGIRIPAEYALLIAERIAAALEHLHRVGGKGRAARHGLLWPGFVSISHDAAVRVGGFGLAEAILPSLDQPRLAAEVGPYLAPESREEGLLDPRADVFALGMILAELLTGRRPSAEAPPPELRAGDPRSDELESFLQRCLAPRESRFASAVDAHREIQQMVTGNPFSLYTANLALFLYKLLNPESQLAAPTSDWESTNPVVLDASSTLSARRVPAIDAPPAAPVAEPVAAPRGEAVEEAEAPPSDPEEQPVEVAAAFEAVAALEANAILEESSEDPEVETAIASIRQVELVPEEDRSVVVFRFPQDGPVPADATGAASDAEPRRHTAPPVAIPPEVLASPVRLWATAWTRPAAALAAAAGLTLAAFLLVSQFRGQGTAPASRPETLAAAAPAPAAPRPAELPAVSAPGASGVSPVSAAAPVAVVLPAGRFEPAGTRAEPSSRRARPMPAPSRQPAEDLRLRAALARIEADRVNARQSAGDLFGEGRHSEEEGERLLRQRDYQAAELAFSRAARLFQQAQEVSWERRLRESDLTNTQ
jgi:serine/threonine protein kinase